MRLGHNPSYTWRNIFIVRDLDRWGTKSKVGSGSSVRIWGDCWIDDDRSFFVGHASCTGV